MAKGVTFCFTDIAASTAMARALGDDEFARLLERHREIIRGALSQAGGEEVSAEGDGFLLAFDDATSALAFATAAQRGLGAEHWPMPVRVRMGLHAGPTDRRPDGDYVGLTVHRAARVSALAAGGQVLVTPEAAADASLPAGVALRSLGRYRVRDFDGPTELAQLVGNGLPDGFPPLRAIREGTGFPLPPTPLLGRDFELDRILELLEAARVVTLLGIGGVGKTRLALEAAALAAPDYPGGVTVVELAPVGGPSEVIATLAGAVGARASAGVELDDALVAALAGAPRLVMLDSCERVIDGAAEAVDLIGRRAPNVTVLATSQEALRVPGEHVVPLGPLTVDLDTKPANSPAVRLLVERAAAAGAAISLEHDGPALAVLARRLDGIPLALELAAARLRDRDVTSVIDSLEDRFAVLTGGYRTADERHRTLEATVAWSIDLLKPEDRALLSRLSRLIGAWRVDLALEICDGTNDALQRLVDRSLAGVEGNAIRLLDTIRAFAVRELDPAEVLELDRRRLAAFNQLVVNLRNQPELDFIRTLRALVPDLLELADVLLDTDYDDLAQAIGLGAPWFEWLGNRSSGIELIDRVLSRPVAPRQRAIALGAIVQLLGVVGENERANAAATDLLAIDDAPPGPRAIALLFLHPVSAPAPSDGEDPIAIAERLAVEHSIAMVLAVKSRRALRSMFEGHYDDAEGVLRELVDEARVHKLPSHETQALVNLGGLLARLGRAGEALPLLEEAERVAASIGLTAQRYGALMARATIALQSGDLDRALTLAEERLALADESGDLRAMAPPLSLISTVANVMGDRARARDAGERMVAIARQMAEPQILVVAAFNLVTLDTADGAVDAAIRWAGEALAGAHGSAGLEPLGVGAVGALAARRGILDGAALIGAVEALQTTAFDPSDREWLKESRKLLAATAGAGAVEERAAEGASLDWPGVLELAEAVLGVLQPGPVEQ